MQDHLTKSRLAHLHVHSEYSIADGSLRISDLIKRAVEFGHKSVALTDHGNLFGAIEFYTEAKYKGLNPIIGAEIYYSGSPTIKRYFDNKPQVFQLVLLAKNLKGYKNLVKIVSSGFAVGTQIPIVEWTFLKNTLLIYLQL